MIQRKANKGRVGKGNRVKNGEEKDENESPN